MNSLRHALRSLARSPGFTALTVGTLGLGIGATAAIFTLLDRVVLNPLPYPAADRLAYVESRVPGMGEGATWGVSVAGFFAFEQQLQTVTSIGAYTPGNLAIARDEGAKQVRSAFVSRQVLPLLGGRPLLGRLIDDNDIKLGSDEIVVLNHGYWATEFGSDSSIVGRTILLEGNPTVVVGVLAPGANLPRRETDLWVPLRLDPAAPAVNAHWLDVIARIKPGITLADFDADLKRVTATFPERFPLAYNPEFMRDSRFTTGTLPLKEFVIGSNARTLWLLLGAVGLVLFIAAANVAALLLVRAEARRTELKVRSALGASRGQIAGYLVTEGLVIAGLGAVVGMVLAVGGIKGLIALAPNQLPRLNEVSVGLETIGFGIGVALLAGLVTSLIPVIHFSGTSPLGMSAVAIGRIHGQQRTFTRNALVVGQLALALMLLASSGLMLKSFQRLRAVDPGFDPAGVLTVEISLPSSRYQNYAATAEFYRVLESGIREIPGVTHAGVISDLPLEGFNGCASVFVEDRPLAPGANPPCLANIMVSPGALAALGVTIEGSEPTWSDLDRESGAVVVTRALAERFWPGENPIGKGIKGNGGEPPFYRVVGVTGDLRAKGLDQASTEAVFFPIKPMTGAPIWNPVRNGFLIIRSQGDLAGLSGAARRAIAEIDPLVATASITTLEEIVRTSGSMARLSFTMILLSIASIMALTLSMVSIYGVIAYLVAQRTPELGLRMVLGATTHQVTALVIRYALVLAGFGLVLGLIGSLLLGKAMRSLLFEVSPVDPGTLGVVSLVLLSVGVIAAWLPAYRAAKTDPMVALRRVS
jgi:putative ABC transport system permease protein